MAERENGQSVCPRCAWAAGELQTAQEMLRDSEGEIDRLRAAIDQAIVLLGPGDDEDSDSPGNMAFAILMAAVSRTEQR